MNHSDFGGRARVREREFTRGAGGRGIAGDGSSSQPMEWSGTALYPLPMHEAHERHLRAALVADGLVSRAALRHGCLVQAALTSELGTPSLGAVLVDLGYLEERALVSRVSSIVRAPVWDGRPPTAGPHVADEAKLGFVVLLSRDGDCVHFATTTPDDEDEDEAVRFATRARRVQPHVATRDAIWRARRAREGASPAPTVGHGPFDPTDDDSPIARFANTFLVDTALHGVTRFVASATGLEVREGRPPHERLLPPWLGPPLRARLLHMAARVDEDLPRERGGIRLLLGKGRLVDFQLHASRTELGFSLLLERRAPSLPEDPPELATFTREADAARRLTDRADSLRRRVAAAEALGDRGVLPAIAARLDLAHTLLGLEALVEASAVVHEALTSCDESAPSVRPELELFLVPTLPRPARSETYARIARALATPRTAHATPSEPSAVSPLFFAEVLETAMAALDPSDTERVTATAEALCAAEIDGLGARAFGVAEARAALAISFARQGDPRAEDLLRDVSGLYAKLYSRPSEADLRLGETARFVASVRRAQGRDEEAVAEARAALGAFARLGDEPRRWASALDVARALPTTRRLEARDLVDGALASGTLSSDDRDAAHALLAGLTAPQGPYR